MHYAPPWRQKNAYLTFLLGAGAISWRRNPLPLDSLSKVHAPHLFYEQANFLQTVASADLAPFIDSARRDFDIPDAPYKQGWRIPGLAALCEAASALSRASGKSHRNFRSSYVVLDGLGDREPWVGEIHKLSDGTIRKPVGLLSVCSVLAPPKAKQAYSAVPNRFAEYIGARAPGYALASLDDVAQHVRRNPELLAHVRSVSATGRHAVIAL